MAVVVFGSINLDLILRVPSLPRPGETILGQSLDMLPGGKGANQALAAQRSGRTGVRLVGCVGTDAFAEPALALLAESRQIIRRSDLGQLGVGGTRVAHLSAVVSVLAVTAGKPLRIGSSFSTT